MELPVTPPVEVVIEQTQSALPADLVKALKPLKRKFVYNGMKLADPGAAMTPEQVKDFHAATNYPELNNAVIDVETKDGVMLIQFRKAVGTKG